MKFLRHARLACAAALALAAGVTGAHAGVIYQSVPDLTAAPALNAFCSQCSSNGQDIGQAFTLGSSAVANTLSFVVQSSFVWPTPVSIDIFQDSGSGTLGSDVYHQTFSSFLSDQATGHNTDVVAVDLGSLSLAAGSYDLFMSNPSNLGIPGFSGGSGRQIFVVNGSTGPLTGDSYNYTGSYRNGLILSGAVPEPATWAMLILGVALIGLSARRRRETAAVAA